MSKLLLAALLFLVGTVGTLAQAATPLDRESSVNLTKSAAFLVGAPKQATVRDVLEATTWERDRGFAFGFQRTPVWEKVQVRSNSTSTYVLSVDHVYISDLRVFVIDDAGKLVSSQASGLGRRVGKDEPEAMAYAFRIPLEANRDYTILVRAKSQFPISLPTHIQSESSFYSSQSTYRALIWFYIGVIISLALYNAFVLLATKDRAYLLYICALLSLHLFSNLAQFGFFRYNVTPHFPAFNIRYFYLTHFFSLLATTLFANHFLDLKRRMPRMRKVLFAFPAMSGLCMLAGLATASIHVDQVNQLNSTIWAFVILYMAFRLARQGQRQARFFFAAWSFLLGFWVVNFLRIDGILPASGASDFAILFGGVAEGTLLALALADRLNTLRRGKAEAEKRTLEAQITADKSEAIARTVQMLAHDAKKPFSTLAAILDSLSLDAAKAPDELRLKIENGAKEVRRSLRSVSDLTRDIMDFGAEANLGALERDVCVKGVLVAALNDTFGATREKHVKLQYQWDHQHRIDCSPYKLARVFANLLDNAEHATKAQGAIWIATRSAVENGRAVVQIAVGNSHSYIAPEDRERIFSAFYTRGKKSGTGLGLAVAKNVVAAHGGRIACFSSQEWGTEFVVTLPAAAADKAFARPQLPADTAGFSVAKAMCERSVDPTTKVKVLPRQAKAARGVVLVVDDNPFILEAWTAKLGRDVARVFDSPSAALAALKDDETLRKNLACAVVDYHFDDAPDSHINGFDLAVALRKLTERPILLASDAEVSREERRAFDRVISKDARTPAEVDALLRA